MLGAVGLAVVGCGGGEQGTAGPQTSAVSVAASPTSVDAEAKVWDPCSLPDSAISGTGLNVGSRKSEVAGVDFTGWKTCSWQDSAKQYTFSVLSSEHTLAESRARTDFTDFTETTVGSHKALQLRTTGSTYELGCTVAVEVPNGSVLFRLLNRVSASSPPAPCPEVRGLTDSLAQYLPEG
ncbi:DUF3558 domain-containing protein [Nocardia sp. XZ_19_231]|uniref:DUF3558 domain-containing protein n=1 Tax=Nocardia sp. XZ_19_231 TaxID=2769252 RepID=UPI001E613756|nr:DUF3558 domain-containing protein [Nocardia sp. XZ_19_231]